MLERGEAAIALAAATQLAAASGYVFEKLHNASPDTVNDLLLAGIDGPALTAQQIVDELTETSRATRVRFEIVTTALQKAIGAAIIVTP